jgi:hypothetical protein
MARTRKKKVEEVQESQPDRIDIEYVDIADIYPYANNPRNNDKAVEAVANSIRSFGFRVPIMVDGENVIIAGHTRYRAACQLELTQVPVVKVTDLSDEKVKQFRIADNKVSEIATWDTDMLQEEFAALQEAGIDISEFVGLGYTTEEIDCLADIVEDDCLSATGFMDDDDRERATRVDPRAPTQARVVISEFVFFLPMEAYKRWSRAVRVENDFNEDDIVADLKARLGMTEYEEAER